MRKTLTLFGLLTLLTSCVFAIDLENSISKAKQNNKELLMAMEEIKKADESYKQVRGTAYPQLNLQGAYGLSKTYYPDSAIPAKMDISSGLDDTASDNDEYLAAVIGNMVNSMIPESPAEAGSFALQLKLEQIVYSGGKLGSGIKAGNYYRQIQRLNYKVKEQDVVLKTTELFYQCLLAKKLWDVQEEGLEIARRHLHRVELFNQEGQVSEFDLLQARLGVAKLEPQVLKAKNDYDLAVSAFRKQIGEEESDIVPEGEFVLPDKMELSLEEATTQGLKQRNEVELIKLSTQLKELQYKVEKVNYLPNVALSADYSLYTSADEYAIQNDDFGHKYGISLGFQMPLFTGLTNTAKRNYARYDYQKAKLQQRDTEELIALQIKQDYQKYYHSWENHNVQSENIRLAERGLQLAQVRYENQVGIQLEVFDAQLTLQTIKLQYYQSIYDIISADRNFKKSIGIAL
ncbi:MAG: TolC family protein [Candidatus Cloacimonas sp.]|nr:TolC family protein [Candidatus Cloacimonas sp.]